ncbi:hypothetical protein TNCT_479701 [Trichonephila clavata]|uniref:Peptidase S1 domain-containing protein n=1 Tax=Trichonephila clavata TaxID=2740835 RepID=A0A8X6HRC7_TRICU|nr:hypothetical protein TNCT_479701 [Trichonephila clavata]
MKTVRRHFCISIVLVAIFQVFNAGYVRGHNAASEYSPKDGYSAVETHHDHPLQNILDLTIQDIQKYARLHYRAQRPSSKRLKRKRPRNKGSYRDVDENKDSWLRERDKGGRVINGKVVKPLYKYPFIGDSGSSNFIKSKGKFYTLGVTSHGKTNYCNPSWLLAYSKVIHYKKWIKQHVNDLAKP